MSPSTASQEIGLHDPVDSLSHVGKQTVAKLHRLGIHDIMDVLLHFPYRYLDRTRLYEIAHLQTNTQACIQGKIISQTPRYRGRQSLVCELEDDTGVLQIYFFHYISHHKKKLSRGKIIRCFGTVKKYNQQLQMVHPEYQVLQREDAPMADTLTPIYPATQGLTQQKLRTISEQALAILRESKAEEVELLPTELLPESLAISFIDAIHQIHRPQLDIDNFLSGLDQTVAHQRLAFEELLAQQASLLYVRRQSESRKAPVFTEKTRLITALQKSFPFQLTDAQCHAWQDIQNDLKKNRPMMRLLQGDVGSGKTVIAALSATQALDNGFQAALLVPTELLSEQHYSNLCALLQPLGMTVLRLSGGMTVKSRKEVLEQLAGNAPLLVVGTHALFQQQAKFGRLGLVIIDEQHRFGVQQRQQLLEKGMQGDFYPHQLLMTATPIPRTLTMTLYANLDCTIMNELPAGRKTIKTVVLSNEKRDAVIERIADTYKQHRQQQSYWICPLIEESETLELETVNNTWELLNQRLSPMRIAMVHGGMAKEKKEQLMQSFKHGEYEILVATTVVEVGVDVPAASLMVIENAERLGLAQLHQLRGRVGRGLQQSTCLLLYQKPLGDIAEKRLDMIRHCNDGFEIAERDLELRGTGELLGKRQTGMPQLRIADPLRDHDLLPYLNDPGRRIISQHPHLIPTLIHRWLGEQSRYDNL